MYHIACGSVTGKVVGQHWRNKAHKAAGFHVTTTMYISLMQLSFSRFRSRGPGVSTIYYVYLT